MHLPMLLLTEWLDTISFSVINQPMISSTMWMPSSQVRFESDSFASMEIQ